MPTLEVRALGPLLVAGDVSSSGVDLATARRRLGGLLVPYIPATALRGAVRIQLEALLRGAGHQVTGPYPLEEADAEVPKDDPVARLFGYSGPEDEREVVATTPLRAAREGKLRFGDALPVDPQAAAASIRVRPGLEIDDEAATAADGKLFFREMAESGADLVFRAPLDFHDITLEDERLLRAAVTTTDSLGAGKAKGGGAIEIRWVEDEIPRGTQVLGEAAQVERARFLITLLEPARFGEGGPLGNHQATRKYIPGATLRGAIAWTLLNHGKTTPEGEGFRALFLQEQAASFGDALMTRTEEEPCVFAATVRQDRLTRSIEDILMRELARERVRLALANSGSLLVPRADDGERRLDPPPEFRRAEHLIRRTRTRVSIDRQTGVAAERKLFSIEQIEATTAEGRPACFSGWIEAIPAAGVPLLAELAGLPIALGSGRNHGLGQVQLELRFEPGGRVMGASGAVHAFSAEVDREAQALGTRAGLGPEDLGAGNLLLALVAQSDYVGSSGDAPHPLGEPVIRARVGRREPLRRFLRASLAGGFDQSPNRKGPLKPLHPAIGAGSVFVYEFEPDLFADLDEVLTVLRGGVGKRVDCGCGRFALHSGPKRGGGKE